MSLPSPRLWIWSLMLAVACVTAATHAGAETLVRAGRLHVVRATEGPILAAGAWSTVCASLGKAMVAGKGPWGFGGLFDDYDCDAPASESPGDFRLTVTERAKTVVIELGVATKGGVRRLGHLTLGTGAISALSRETHARLVAAAILDEGPALARFPAARLDGGPLAIAPLSSLPPPKQLNLYRLRFLPEDGAFRAELVGSAELRDGDASASYHFQWASPVPRLMPDEPVFAQDARGFDRRRPEIAKALRRERATPTPSGKAASDSVSPADALDLVGLGSSYVGVRYGWSLLDSDIFDDTRVVGAVLVLKSGPAAGLELALDAWPETRKELNGETGRFGGYRLIVGWSFAYRLDSFISSLYVKPAVGAWTFHVSIPIARENGPTIVAPFSTDRALSVGAEGGIEKSTSRFSLRAWHARNIGLSIGNAIDAASVLTVRTGLDLFVRGFQVGAFDLSFLGFAFDESMRLERDGAAGDDVVLTFVEFNQIYAGVGVSLAW